jgi:hypothetical protein
MLGGRGGRVGRWESDIRQCHGEETASGTGEGMGNVIALLSDDGRDGDFGFGGGVCGGHGCSGGDGVKGLAFFKKCLLLRRLLGPMRCWR